MPFRMKRLSDPPRGCEIGLYNRIYIAKGALSQSRGYCRDSVANNQVRGPLSASGKHLHPCSQKQRHSKKEEPPGQDNPRVKETKIRAG